MFKLKPEDEEKWSKSDQEKAVNDYLNSAYPGLADIVKNDIKRDLSPDLK